MKGLAALRCFAALVLGFGGGAVCAQPHSGEAGGARSAAPTLWSAAMSRQDVQLGRIDADHDDDYVYRLPYAANLSFPVIQGYGSKLSHRGAERFTVDFGMPVGTLVHAAREGVVALVEDSHAAGCAREDCGRFANFVVVLHSDGTTGEYFHLERGSAAVRVGERVARGEVLARSGNTGFSTVPHLHFGVYRLGTDGRNESLAVRFKTRGGAIAAPRSGARYLDALD